MPHHYLQFRKVRRHLIDVCGRAPQGVGRRINVRGEMHDESHILTGRVQRIQYRSGAGFRRIHLTRLHGYAHEAEIGAFLNLRTQLRGGTQIHGTHARKTSLAARHHFGDLRVGHVAPVCTPAPPEHRMRYACGIHFIDHGIKIRLAAHKTGRKLKAKVRGQLVGPLNVERNLRLQVGLIRGADSTIDNHGFSLSELKSVLYPEHAYSVPRDSPSRRRSFSAFRQQTATAPKHGNASHMYSLTRHAWTN